MAATLGSGYSGTPLAGKLGIREGSHLFVKNPPQGYLGWLEPLPLGLVFDQSASEPTDIVHLFLDRRAVLQTELGLLRGAIRRDAGVWVSWPKRSSGVPTDITEDGIRELALPLGFVDVKVCAVSEVWSGLKLVIRKELR